MIDLARLARVVLVLAAAFVGPAAAQQCSIVDVSTYCTAGTTVHGCVPSISGVGVPNAVDTSGFDIVVGNAPGQRFGTIFFGFYPASIPWAPFSPSYRCVAVPLQRMGQLSSGGVAGQCDGEFRLDFNAWRAANPNGLGSPYVNGQVLHAQGWFRDPAAPKQTNLSDALRFVLGPSTPSPQGMKPIPAGTFSMGSNAACADPYWECGNGQPVHQVTISYCFWMGEREVTQAQYAALMGSNPSFFPGGNNPVEQVSWFDAQAYCAALTAQQSALGNVPPGYQYRLPTEAEWEYACRAGTTTEFNVGNDLLCDDATFQYSYHSNSECNGLQSGTEPVGDDDPNEWGLYDTHGNVFEWCLDSIAGYSALSVTDPFVTGGTGRVFRGGSWGSLSIHCRSAYRDGNDAAHTGVYVGFRVALAPILVP